jgi:hypothetical protein
LKVANNLAYYDTAKITAIITFIVQASSNVSTTSSIATLSTNKLKITKNATLSIMREGKCFRDALLIVVMLTVAFKIIMLNVVKLSVVKLSVVVPRKWYSALEHLAY